MFQASIVHQQGVHICTKPNVQPFYHPKYVEIAILSIYDYKVGYSDELERIPHEGDVSRIGCLVLYKCAFLDDGPVRPKTCRRLQIKALL